MKLNIGLVGAGYMGKAHALAIHSVGPTFNTNIRPVPYMIATSTPEGASQKAKELGFLFSTGDWRDLVNDPAIGAIIIASPQNTHYEIAKAALAARKHVFCEKPLSASLPQSEDMVSLASANPSLITMIGFNYIQAPAMQMAKKMIKEGVLGTIHFMRAEQSEDFMANPLTPANWRTEYQYSGTMMDLAPHIVNAALGLLGEIESLVADIGTVYKQRPSADTGKMVPVLNDDYGQFLCKFKNGASGNLLFSRVATGQKCHYSYEIYGSEGALKFDMEDQNVLWYYDSKVKAAHQGFTRLLMGTPHPNFQALCPGDGHGTGYGEQIVVELYNFLTAIEKGEACWPSFADGLSVDKVIDAAFQSWQSKSWVSIN